MCTAILLSALVVCLAWAIQHKLHDLLRFVSNLFELLSALIDGGLRLLANTCDITITLARSALLSPHTVLFAHKTNVMIGYIMSLPACSTKVIFAHYIREIVDSPKDLDQPEVMEDAAPKLVAQVTTQCSGHTRENKRCKNRKLMPEGVHYDCGKHAGQRGSV